MKKISTFLVVVTAILNLNAQNGANQLNGEKELGSWFMYFGTNKIAEKWSIHTEAQFRYYETASNFNQMLLRTGVNYHINSDAIATLGYGYIDTDPTFVGSLKEANLSEHRIFEQFILKNKVWEFNFEHRYRLEQRFISQTNILSDPEQDLGRTEHRARYRLQVTLPLTDTFFLNFYDEIFLNLQNEAFGQNRLYAAVGVNVTSELSMQFGYLKNHFRQADFDRLQLGIVFNTDLRGVFKEKSE
ncbi:DUF2490 domain-containing protein [Maribacter sp. ACAM166]|uniref:DUF2490 domain-containing protein n=1 Tax=Maribacter sp. ACAM166 TaxID=2508996 RepID=UPI0010FE99A3|nr:DUF2490 domain-containing protein [Maribacter sp. ACAM166]TLP80229.1 DUF2490 domain-containing protein [Maribacter sp. ACAM166]